MRAVHEGAPRDFFNKNVQTCTGIGGRWIETRIPITVTEFKAVTGKHPREKGLPMARCPWAIDGEEEVVLVVDPSVRPRF